jgi:hypothetical protein
MIDGEKRTNVEENSTGKSFTNISNDSTFLQSLRVRCGTIFSDIGDRKFMESELRLVLYCGTIFWVIFLLSQVI